MKNRKLKKMMASVLGAAMMVTMCPYRLTAAPNMDMPVQNDAEDYTGEEMVTGAVSGALKNGSYTLDENGVLTISGTGIVGEWGADLPWIDELGKIKRLVIEEGVTWWDGSFENYSNLVSVSLPSSFSDEESLDDMSFANCVNLKTVEFADGINIGVLPKFLGCISLEEIKLPSSITTIGYYTFYNCASLKKIELNEGLETICPCAFTGCTSLESLHIPASVEHIYHDDDGYNAFLGWPEEWGSYDFGGYDDIENGLIKGLPALASITVDPANSHYMDEGCNVIIDIFEKDLLLGCKNTDLSALTGVETIEKGAFFGCTGLKSAILPEGLKYIENDAFCRSGIEQLYLPNSVESVEYNSFNYCENLSSIEVSDDNSYFTDLDSNAVFYILSGNSYGMAVGCKTSVIPDLDPQNNTICLEDGIFRGIPLEELFIPACVTEYSENYEEFAWSFGDCKKLKKITVSQNNPIFDSNEDSNALILKDQNVLVVGCKGTVIPDTVKAIGNAAFFGSGIENLYIPASVTDIGIGITGGCDDLSSITVAPTNAVYRADGNCLIKRTENRVVAGCKSSVIPNDTKIIDRYAFRRITTLTSVVIPENVESIENEAFFMCSGLKNVTLPVGLKNLGNPEYDMDGRVFYGCSSLENIVIPGGLTFAGGGNLYYCDSLKSISIPADYPGLADGAIYYMYGYGDKCSLTDVYFGGSKEQWRSYLISEFGGYNLFDSLNVHFNAQVPGDTGYTGEIDPDNPDNPDDPSGADAEGLLKEAIAANKGAVTDTIGFTVDNSKKKPVYTVSPSQNGLAITVVKGSKFTIVGGEKKSFTSNSGNVKVSSKGVVSAKKAESKAEIKYKLQGETEPKTLYVTVIEPGLAKAENTNGEIKKLSLSAVTGNVIDATLAFPINATIGSVKGKTACVKDLKTEVSANGIHITGTADQKGNLTIPITATGKKYNVKIKVKASK